MPVTHLALEWSRAEWGEGRRLAVGEGLLLREFKEGGQMGWIFQLGLENTPDEGKLG